jgi:pyruvate dehydrogenase E1 component alpha subunit
MAAWREKDPIPRFRAWLETRGYLTSAEDDRLTAEVRAEIAAATEFARQSPWPAPEAALEDVYA